MKKSIEMLLDLQDMGQQIKNLIASGEYKGELDEEFKSLSAQYKKLVAEEKATAQKNGGIKMNKKAMQDQIFKAMLLGKEFTDDMKASGIELPKFVDTIGTYGNVGGNSARGGYLVSEEFLGVDIYGGDVVAIPARDIAVGKPSGKVPQFNLSQAKATNKFLFTFDELDTIGRDHPTFGQLDFTTVDKAGIVPVSMRLLDDADSDVLGMVANAIGVAAAYQRNADIVSALAGINNIAAVYAGTGKTFEDKEGIKALIKAVRGKLTGVNRTNAKILVCDTDFAKLACATNGDGDFYMRPAVWDPAKFAIDGVEVIAVDDAHFTSGSTVGGYAYVGNFDRVAYINRKGLEISTDISAGFTQDALLVKGVKRAVVKVLEDGAFVKVCEGAAAQ